MSAPDPFDDDPMATGIWDDMPSNTPMYSRPTSNSKLDRKADEERPQPENESLFSNYYDSLLENNFNQDYEQSVKDDEMKSTEMNPIVNRAKLMTNQNEPDKSKKINMPVISTIYNPLITPVNLKFQQLDLESSPLGPSLAVEESRSDSPPPKKYIKPDIHAVLFLINHTESMKLLIKGTRRIL